MRHKKEEREAQRSQRQAQALAAALEDQFKKVTKAIEDTRPPALPAGFPPASPHAPGAYGAPPPPAPQPAPPPPASDAVLRELLGFLRAGHAGAAAGSQAPSPPTAPHEEEGGAHELPTRDFWTAQLRLAEQVTSCAKLAPEMSEGELVRVMADQMKRAAVANKVTAFMKAQSGLEPPRPLRARADAFVAMLRRA